MLPTDVLMKEHRIIEQVLACLEKLVERSEKSGQLDARAARDAISFFRCFADRCHHGKEEDLLFPMMESKGFSNQSGPLPVMRFEHEEGRDHVRRMDAAIGGAAEGRPKDLEAFATHARSYIQLLRDHIGKEDHCLFPMADQVLQSEDQRELLSRFERVEHEEIGESTHEAFRQLADELADQLGVPRAHVETGCRSSK